MTDRTYPNGDPEEFTSQEGAARLGDHLRSWWYLRTQKAPRVVTIQGVVSYNLSCTTKPWDVRSDMINGMPRGVVFRPSVDGKKGRFVVKEDQRSDAKALGAHDAGTARGVHRQDQARRGGEPVSCRRQRAVP